MSERGLVNEGPAWRRSAPELSRPSRRGRDEGARPGARPAAAQQPSVSRSRCWASSRASRSISASTLSRYGRSPGLRAAEGRGWRGCECRRCRAAPASRCSGGAREAARSQRGRPGRRSLTGPRRVPPGRGRGTPHGRRRRRPRPAVSAGRTDPGPGNGSRLLRPADNGRLGVPSWRTVVPGPCSASTARAR
jgi:hypothetical protein